MSRVTPASNPHPTDAQIAGIPRPARPEALRPLVSISDTLDEDEDLWLRLCCDKDKEEQHGSVWAKNLDAEFVGLDGIILDNGIFAGRDLSRALELFPERVTNKGGDVYFGRRDRAWGELRYWRIVVWRMKVSGIVI